MKVWGRLFQGEKCIRHTVVECLNTTQALEMLCQALDIPRPVVLGKHEREMERFRHTQYKPIDFIEDAGCDRFLMEILPEKKTKN